MTQELKLLYSNLEVKNVTSYDQREEKNENQDILMTFKWIHRKIILCKKKVLDDKQIKNYLVQIIQICGK